MTGDSRRYDPAVDEIVNYPNFGSSAGSASHHDSALLANLLGAGGITDPLTGEPYTEAMLTGLAGGVGFMYALFEYKGWAPMVTLVLRRHPDDWVETVLARVAASADISKTTSAAKARTTLDSTLADGRPVMVTVLRDGLDWHAIMPMTGGPYEVAVIGRAGGDYLVDDVGPTPRSIGIERLAQLRAADKKVRHRAVSITGAQTIDAVSAVRAALADTHRVFTGPVLGHSFDVNFGLSGLDRLASALEDTRTKKGWTRVAGTSGEAAHSCLRRLHDCVRFELSADGGMRPQYAAFCRQIAEPLGEGRLEELASMWDIAGERWSLLAETSLALPGAFGRYRELADERQRLLHSGEGADRMAEIRDEMAALPTEAEISADVLADQLGALAGIVREIEVLETEAIQLLGAIVDG